jgi:hypothetical protein
MMPRELGGVVDSNLAVYGTSNLALLKVKGFALTFMLLFMRKSFSQSLVLMAEWLVLYYRQDLKRGRLNFGWLVDGYIQPNYWFRENKDGSKEVLTLLTNYMLWSRIEELELEIATDQTIRLDFLTSLNLTPRPLTLPTLTLVPSHRGGNSAVPAITKGLTDLTRSELASLCEFLRHRRQRLLFDAQAPPWANKSAYYMSTETAWLIIF